VDTLTTGLRTESSKGVLMVELNNVVMRSHEENHNESWAGNDVRLSSCYVVIHCNTLLVLNSVNLCYPIPC